MNNPARQCKATTRTGEPCRANAIADSDYCFTHDPTSAEQRRAARSKGGAARQGRTLAPADTALEPVSVKTTADICALVERTINDCMVLENSLNRARVVGYLAGIACKALELDQLADRVAALESILKARAQA